MKTPKLILMLLCAAGCGADGAPTGAIDPAQTQAGDPSANQGQGNFDPTAVQLSQVTSFTGLSGNYVRVPYVAPVGELLNLELQPVEKGQTEGTFTEVVSEFCPYVGCNVLVGDYNAVPVNPAVGFAFISLVSTDLLGVQHPETYIVDGASSDDKGISVMKLHKLYANVPGVAFYVRRIP